MALVLKIQNSCNSCINKSDPWRMCHVDPIKKSDRWKPLTLLLKHRRTRLSPSSSTIPTVGPLCSFSKSLKPFVSLSHGDRRRGPARREGIVVERSRSSMLFLIFVLGLVLFGCRFRCSFVNNVICVLGFWAHFSF